VQHLENALPTLHAATDGSQKTFRPGKIDTNNLVSGTLLKMLAA
jgi:hypothetical protein